MNIGAILTLLKLFEESGLTKPKTPPVISKELKKRREFIELGLKRPDQWINMEIDAYILIIYATVWTIFYWFLSQYIAELSSQKWTTWVESEESDETLMNALQVIVDEIEDRMHDKLEHFQKSFFGSLGAASKKLDDATAYSDQQSDVVYRFQPAMCAGLAYYLAQKRAPERVEMLKIVYEDELRRALVEDGQRTSVYIAPKDYFPAGI